MLTDLLLLRDDWAPPTPPQLLRGPDRYLSAKVRVSIDRVLTVFERNECTRRG